MFLKKILSYSFGSFCGRFFGSFRDIVFSSVFGANQFTDFFHMAFRFPMMLRTFFADGAVYGSLVPEISFNLGQGNKDKAVAITQNFFSFMLFFLIGFITVSEIFMPYLGFIIAPGYNTERMGHLIGYMRLLYPIIATYSLFTILVSIQNATGRFWVQPTMRLILDGIMVFTMLTFCKVSKDPLSTISYAVLVAGVLQVLWAYWLGRCSGFKIRIQKPVLSPELKDLLIRMIQTSGASLGIYINVFIDMSFASYLAPGSLTYLVCAEKMHLIAADIMGISLGTVLLPHFSKIREDAELLGREINKALKLVLRFTLPVAILLFITRDVITCLFYAHGRFTLEDCINTSNVFAFYGSMLPAYTYTRIFTNFYFAQKKQSIPIKVTVLTIIANLVGILLLMKPFGYVGMACATLIASSAGVAYYFFITRALIVFDKEWLIILIQNIALAALAYFSFKFLGRFSLEASFLLNLFKTIVFFALFITAYVCAFCRNKYEAEG